MLILIPQPVLNDKKALVIGIANEYSIAWGCAQAFHELGAELAISYRRSACMRSHPAP